MQAALRFDVVVPPVARSGERVPITLRVTNAGDRAIELYLRGRTIAFDIVIARQGGGVVWRRLEGQTIPAILQVRSLAPGQSLEFADTWVAVAPGRFTVRGELLTEGGPMRTAPADLEVRPARE